MRILVLSILSLCSIVLRAQEAIDFNRDWQVHYPSKSLLHAERTEMVTLPRAWNEEFAFRVPIELLPDDTVRYTKRFLAPKTWKGKKVFVEFEGARQSAEVFINGHRLGLHQNGVMAFGYDLTPYIKVGKENILEVLTDNDWKYHEKNPDGTEIKVKDGVVVKDGNDLPNNELKPTSFQWNNKNFNANYGGLPKNVRLHVLPALYQTLPLYSQLGTTGTYVYAKEIDVTGHRATVHAESQVRNETGKAVKASYKVEVIDCQSHETVASFCSPTYNIGKGETITMMAEESVEKLHFWSWGYGYLYDVVTTIQCPKNTQLESVRKTTTGFRKTDFRNGITYLNDRAIMMHGYAQRTSNEWPGVGMSVTPWLSDYSNRLMVESGGNLVRWMHVCPWKQDIESCDRVGLMQAMPAGDAEKDVTGRHWEQRTELMRDAIIYNRNNPSVIFYECGNKGISEAHMQEMKAIRDQYDPYGGRAIGSREMLNHATSAEYGGEMLYINKSATKPVWAMEYCRDEALRRYWDDWSPLYDSACYHKQGVGPLYRNADASAYNQNNDQFAVEMVRRWFDYWQERPGTGDRVSNGGVKIVFSDTNTHNRGESNYRTSGVVDAMRLPKDAFYAHQVMWNGWVTPEKSQTYIVGHWTYPEGTVKPVYVISDAPVVKLYLNPKGAQTPKQLTVPERIDYHFLHTFDSIPFVPGTLTAISYDEQGCELSRHEVRTTGEPAAVVANFISPVEGKLNADGADMGFVDFRVVDEQGRTCPLAYNMVHFSVEGPVEWIGGIAYRDSVKYREEWEKNPNCIRSLDLPVECGVNRALVRSLPQKGKAIIRYEVEGLQGSNARGQLEIDVTAMQTAACGVPSSLMRGETPSSPSYRDFKRTLHPQTVTAGCNQETATYSIDNSEDTEWKNDGRASTAWVRYDFSQPVCVDEVCMKLTGWRQRSYPIEILADTTVVWQGNTPQSLGYVHLTIEQPVVAQSITIRLKGTATSNDAFGQITELVEPVANELDLYKAKDGDKVRSELRIVECDFLQLIK